MEAKSGKVLFRAMATLYANRPGRGASKKEVNNILADIAESFGTNQAKLSEIGGGTFGRMVTLEKEGQQFKARVWVQGDIATMNALNDRAFFGSFSALK